MSEKFALLGYPVAHSLSPRIYTRIFRELNLPASYEAIATLHLDADVLADLHQQGFVGFSVTIPHKHTAFRAATPQDTVSHASLACNTLVLAPQGAQGAHGNQQATLSQANASLKNRAPKCHWVGYNTDGGGAMTALASQISPPYSDVVFVILGTGGAAAGLLGALSQIESSKIILSGRNTVKGNALLQHVASIAPHKFSKSPATLLFVKLQELSKQLNLIHSQSRIKKNHLVIINCTPIGLHSAQNLTGDGQLPTAMKKTQEDSPFPFRIDSPFLSASPLFFDMVYNPVETPFLKIAKKLGCPVVYGRQMFLAQAVRQARIFLQYRFPAISQSFAADDLDSKLKDWIEQELNKIDDPD